jgi:hypothetical protein
MGMMERILMDEVERRLHPIRKRLEELEAKVERLSTASAAAKVMEQLHDDLSELAHSDSRCEGFVAGPASGDCAEDGSPYCEACTFKRA